MMILMVIMTMMMMMIPTNINTNKTQTIETKLIVVIVCDFIFSSDILISYNTTISLADGATAPSFSKTLIRGLSEFSTYSKNIFFNYKKNVNHWSAIHEYIFLTINLIRNNTEMF